MTTATAKVLGVVELLEQILSWLPLADLLFFRAVCRSWLTLIDSSTVLDKFLVARPPHKAWILCHLPDDNIEERSSYSVTAIVPASEALAARDFHWDKISLSAIPNPSFLHRGDSWQGDDINIRAAAGETLQLALPNGRVLIPQTDRCRDMFLTQPPVWEVHLSTFHRFRPGDQAHGALTEEGMRLGDYVTITRIEGVRYRDLLPFLLEAEEKRPLAKVAVDMEGVVFASEDDWREAKRQVALNQERSLAAALQMEG